MIIISVSIQNPAGNTTHPPPPDPMPGMWIKRHDGDSGVYWLDPHNTIRHYTGTCTPCTGVNACDRIQAVSDAFFDSIPQGPNFGCDLIGAGGAGNAAYFYPSLMDLTSTSINYEDVGPSAVLFLVTSNCVTWSQSGACSPFDYDGNLHRDVVSVPVQFA